MRRSLTPPAIIGKRDLFSGTTTIVRGERGKRDVSIVIVAVKVERPSVRPCAVIRALSPIMSEAALLPSQIAAVSNDGRLSRSLVLDFL